MESMSQLWLFHWPEGKHSGLPQTADVLEAAKSKEEKR
jgi:hypothetical protein